MPKIAITALKEGTSAGVVPDMDGMLKEYYDFMQWDWDSGKPKRDKLVELGLDDVAQDLWG
jgi:aldehyde:ferredoxin oxidoreductase